jgi:IclR family transcriptional regulator, KDG regulon repressor
MEQNRLQAKPSNLIQTIERMDAILEAVGRSPQGASIKDLSAALGLPKGTVHRILSSLSYFGYVRQHPETKNYGLGLKLMELGSRLGSQLDLRRVAAPFIRTLVDKTGEAAHLVVLDGGDVVYIDKIEARENSAGLVMASRVGSRNPAHCCAVGKVLLAGLPEGDLDALLGAMELARRTANTITDPVLLKEHLRTVREQGYAVDDEENERGIRCLAAPIFDGKGRAVAAVSISGPSFRVTKKVVLESVRKEVTKAAAEISRQLGF